MKNCFLILLSLFSLSLPAQDIYLHCGKLADTENGEILTQKTIVVSGKKITSILNGYIDSANPEDSIIDLKSNSLFECYKELLKIPVGFLMSSINSTISSILSKYGLYFNIINNVKLKFSKNENNQNNSFYQDNLCSCI